mmetsp:Transcript_87694/g.246357  ORF Transcript_87694/g.246357 Transcript_87694/m.246357 type:complete len:367 (+) Transcript_87694:39-1139(+)|eukprot:CAMPEP_0117495246 /NCGR_PEP_ID=MMETSP0784-20121206/20032_1 /TAXON_ID=39447 /ORGANISM="" /LENGTH=366 /DNA_ID=CAMNT_0005290159 /DNA_START=39 /DNA_END=1139 /DNA_ORIENTATION=+
MATSTQRSPALSALVPSHCADRTPPMLALRLLRKTPQRGEASLAGCRQSLAAPFVAAAAAATAVASGVRARHVGVSRARRGNLAVFAQVKDVADALVSRSSEDSRGNTRTRQPVDQLALLYNVMVERLQEVGQLCSGVFEPDVEQVRYQTGWPELDALHEAIPGEVTFVTTTDGHLDSVGRTRSDLRAAVSIVLAQVARLAGCAGRTQRRWSFRLVFDAGAPEEYFSHMQGFAPELHWLFEHFSIDVAAPSVPVDKLLGPENTFGALRGVVLVRRNLDGSSLQDFVGLRKLAKRSGFHIWLVGVPLPGDSHPNYLEASSDNVLTVRATEVGRAEVHAKKRHGRLARACGSGRGDSEDVRDMQIPMP